MPPIGDYLYKATSLTLFTITVVGGAQAIMMTRNRMKQMEIDKQAYLAVC